MNTIESLAGALPGVSHTVAIAGQSLLLGANAPNFGSMYVMLDEFHIPRGQSRRPTLIGGQLKELFEQEVHDGEMDILVRLPSTGSARPAASRSLSRTAGDTGLRGARDREH